MVEVTRDRIVPIGAAIGPAIRDRIRDLRDRAGMSRDELAEQARQYGAPENFTANVVGFVERGRRALTVEELLAVAQALEVSPLELLGEQADAFIGGAGPADLVCPRCDGQPAAVERSVRDVVAKLGELKDMEPALAEAAYALAKEIDAGGGEGGKLLPALTKELRATLAALKPGRQPPPAGSATPDLDPLGGLGDPD